MSLLPDAALDHVAQPCPDLAAGRAFYARLGFTPGFAKPGLHQMELGACKIELIEGAVPPQAAPVPAHVALRVPDAQAAYARLETAGLRPDAPPRRGASGVLFFFLRDPAGNWIEIVSP
ncbi:VOC family protein [Oceanicola sp. S124]|uniref:VOC family protein n=1 Tax=Oceanicola sp. S124 TaxID=1042378 RepID=UPI000255856F|nr:VOC family protein [Oceanicola sp. S124]